MKKNDIDTVFIDDKGEKISNLAEIKQLNYRFKDYKEIYFDSPRKKNKIAPIEKEWYLMGIEPDIKKTDEHIFTNPEILISLINLGSKINDNNGLYNGHKRDELALCEDIKEWCMEYGLPYREEYFYKNYPKQNNSSTTILNNSAFRLWEFKRSVTELYNIINLWYGLTFNDAERIIKYSGSFRFSSGKIDLNKDWDEQKSLLKESLAFSVNLGSSASLDIKYNKKNDSYEIIPYTDSLLSVAYFQLAMLMTNKGSVNVKFCSICKKLFIVEHGNTKVCNSCKREYHRIKTQESRRKSKKNM